MGLVVNDTVKMEWDEKLWLQTKGGKKKQPAFITAGKEYDSATDYGKIVVFFTPECAFLLYDDEEDEVLGMEDVVDMLGGKPDDGFPTMYDECRMLVDTEIDGEDYKDKILSKVVENFGLSEFIEDICARLADIRPFNETWFED